MATIDEMMVAAARERRTCSIGSHVRVIAGDDGVCVQYHGNTIFRILPNGFVYIDLCTYNTATTVRKINALCREFNLRMLYRDGSNTYADGYGFVSAWRDHKWGSISANYSEDAA